MCLGRQGCKSATQSKLSGQAGAQTPLSVQWQLLLSVLACRMVSEGGTLESDCETGDVKKLSHWSKISRLGISYLDPCRPAGAAGRQSQQASTPSCNAGLENLIIMAKSLLPHFETKLAKI